MGSDLKKLGMHRTFAIIFVSFHAAWWQKTLCFITRLLLIRHEAAPTHKRVMHACNDDVYGQCNGPAGRTRGNPIDQVQYHHRKIIGARHNYSYTLFLCQPSWPQYTGPSWIPFTMSSIKYRQQHGRIGVQSHAKSEEV
jgi:hypothetical protein